MSIKSKLCSLVLPVIVFPAILPVSLLADDSVLTTILNNKSIPSDFVDHLFDVPLAIRVVRDGHPLGGASAVIHKDGTIRLLEFTDVSESDESDTRRNEWLNYLSKPTALGECHSDCEKGLIALHYSMENSQLTILTNEKDKQNQRARFYALPENGSQGMIVQNQLSLFTGAQEGGTSGTYSPRLTASVGNWTIESSYQVSRDGQYDARWQHSLGDIYAQRELKGHFVRAGRFYPSFYGSSLNLPTIATGDNMTGFMWGNSDSLLINDGQKSLYPIYVTASRQSVAEIYRDGKLIQSQQVEAGLQTLATENLPSGIYNVEIRLVTDGRISEVKQEVVNKPSHWSNTDQRWRYGAFAGRSNTTVNTYNSRATEELTAGAMLNYLLLPGVVVGGQYTSKGNIGTTAGAVEWFASDTTSFYTSGWHNDAYGSGGDFQAMWRLGSNSVMYNYSKTWQPRNEWLNNSAGQTETSAITFNRQLSPNQSLSLRNSWNKGLSEGPGFDAALSHRQELWGANSTWRFSVFDRPVRYNSEHFRDRGGEITMSLSLGNSSDRTYSASMGSRTSRTGSRDIYNQFSMEQSFQEGIVRGVSAGVAFDRYGAGLSTGTTFDSKLAGGSLFAQRSTMGGPVSGGANLSSTLAIGGGEMIMTSEEGYSGSQTGVILDVDSDLPDVELRADSEGSSLSNMKSGRHFISVPAWKRGSLQLDFASAKSPSATISPSSFSYHLNKGGVQVQHVKVIETVTVMGYLYDSAGKPLRGALIKSQSGKNVSDVDGFFVMDMGNKQPEIRVEKNGQTLCSFTLDESRYPRKKNTVMAGSLICKADIQRPATHDKASMDLSNEK